MSTQEGTRGKPGNQHDTATCEHISRVLSRIADKWTILVVRTLGNGPLRFNALRRAVGEISQKMLSSTLRDLEENGFVSRTVTPTVPPQVEYELTRLGRKFLVPVHGLAGWVATNAKHIDAARAAYARRNGRPRNGLSPVLPKATTSLVARRKRLVEWEEQQSLPDD